MKTGNDLFKQKITRKTDAPHETADCVNELQKYIDFTDKYGYKYWLRKCKGKTLPYIQWKIQEMKDVDKWLQETKGKRLDRGKWMTNNI